MGDEIRIDLKSDVDEGEKARRKLAQVESQVKQLKSSFEQGNVATSVYNKELASLERQANRTRAAIDKIKPAPALAGRLTGVDRAGAMSRSALLGANILQDVIQGGPASGINNVLGAANDRGIKALAGEALAAAGGIKVVAAAVGVFAITAGAAFATVDHLLGKSKLGWGDMLDVVGNVGPFKVVGEIIDGIGKSETWSILTTELSKDVSYIADVTLGWNKAVNAVKRHKEEVLQATQATKEYADANKSLASVKSPEQVQQEAEGKHFIEQVARQGGKRGLTGVADALTAKETERLRKRRDPVTGLTADKALVTVKNEKGEDEQITRLEQIRRRIVTDLAKAAQGDVDALGRIRAQLDRAGIGTTFFTTAKEEKDLEEKKKRDDERNERLFREGEAQRAGDKGLAGPFQDRFNALAASGQAPDQAGVEKGLLRSGVGAPQASRAASAVLDALQTGFNEAVTKRASEKGISFATASSEMLREHQEKTGREAETRADVRTAGTALNAKVDDALLRAGLRAGGAAGLKSKEVEEELKNRYMAAGSSEQEATLAARQKVKERPEALGDEVRAGAMRPDQAPRHIASADFARSVESAGQADAKKMLTTMEGAKLALEKIERNVERGARLAP